MSFTRSGEALISFADYRTTLESRRWNNRAGDAPSCVMLGRHFAEYAAEVMLTTFPYRIVLRAELFALRAHGRILKHTRRNSCVAVEACWRCGMHEVRTHHVDACAQNV